MQDQSQQALVVDDPMPMSNWTKDSVIIKGEEIKETNIENSIQNMETIRQNQEGLQPVVKNAEPISEDEYIVAAIEQIWDKYDVDKSGELDKHETLKFVQDLLGNMGSGSEFSCATFGDVFAEFDKDGSGEVEKAEMVLFIKELCAQMGCQDIFNPEKIANNSKMREMANKRKLKEEVVVRKCKIQHVREKGLNQINLEKDEFTTTEDLGNKKKYTSRRMKDYNDDDSGSDLNYMTTMNTGVIKYKDTQGKETIIKPNVRFKNYKDVFRNLLKTQPVVTMYPIVSMVISFDSTRGITVTKKDDFESWVKMYDLNTGELKFEEKIFGDLIKIKEVEQNTDGSGFAIVYCDDGAFKLRTFGKESRTEEEIAKEEFNINEKFGLDNYTMCNQDFPDPYITCCFITKTKIFVNFFHNYTLMHYHFIYNTETRQIIGDRKGKPITRKLDCTLKNFPYKSFYNEEKNEIYSFYRQGQTLTIEADDLTKYRFERMTELDLGQMILFMGEALIARSSSRVLFFKQVTDRETKKTSWKQYHQIRVRGFIYFIKGNIRIQVTTDEIIYFYLIDQETFLPNLENCMYNYMGCNQMMFGRRVRYGIAYKTNQRSFDIYKRKYMHNLKVCVNDDNFEGAKGIELIKMNTFLITKIDKVMMFDSDTFQQCGTIPIKLLVSDTRERTEVIGIQKSKDEEYLAIISGKNLIMNVQKQNQLFIFKKVPSNDELGLKYDTFDQIKRVVLKDIPEFKLVGMTYYFKNYPPQTQPNTILFTKLDKIFELNFMTEEIKTIHTFKLALKCQPNHFVPNSDQTTFVCGSMEDGIWVDINTNREEDLDIIFNVSLVLDVIIDTESKEYYLMCNKHKGMIGFYLIKFQSHEPNTFSFVTLVNNKLDIGDVNMKILRGNDKQGNYKELLIGYKTIYINTYNLVVQDLSGDESERASLLRHESFQLWESSVSGMVLAKNKDFVKLSKTGIDILALGAKAKRPLISADGSSKIIHSLDSLSFLKVDALNYMNFKCQDYSNRIISIEQENHIWDGCCMQTSFEDIYKIKIHEVTLREILILQSFYITRTPTEIVNLVKMQPDPKFFYKTFLELDGSNMASILAFDSGCIECLLSDSNKQYFSSEFPIIYKNKMEKKGRQGYYYLSAIDCALKNNQIKGVNLMIDYIVTYQNNYISSYLFLKIMPVLLEKGVTLYNLYNSDVFTITFDFDEWPGNHVHDEETIRQYRHSYFHLRHHYRTVFPEDHFKPIAEGASENDPDFDNTKVFKIKYSINLLPQIGFWMSEPDKETGEIESFNEDISLMGQFSETEEIEVFQTKVVKDLVEFKWQTFGRNHHLFGCFMHMGYLFVYILYVKNACMVESSINEQILYAALLTIGIFYPAAYDLTQLQRGGLADYVSDPWNFADFIYIWGSVANSILQIVLGPYHLATRVIMSTIVVLLITKTFFFMRIFPTLTPLVVMITNVIYDLRIFLFFYFILILQFSQLFAVVGLGNRNLRTDLSPSKRELLDIAVDYETVGLHVGEFMWTLRISMGDFAAVEDSMRLQEAENIVFWIIWLTTVVVTCIIFLNFIVAEASASYSRVVETLEEVIWMEKAALIAESEDMTFQRFKTPDKYPKYIIIREVEH